MEAGADGAEGTSLGCGRPCVKPGPTSRDTARIRAKFATAMDLSSSNRSPARCSDVPVFDRALIIAELEKQDDPLPAEIVGMICGLDDRIAVRECEKLVSEGYLVRSEHSTYCGECGSDSGVEYRYSLVR